MGAPARADRRHRPRLRPARNADLAAAGEADARPGRCSATTGRRPAASASSGSSTSRRSAIRGRPIDAEIIELGARGSTARSASRASRSTLNSIGDANCRPAYIEKLAGTSAPRRRAAADRARRLARNPLRLLDSKEPAMAAVSPRRRGSPTTCATPAPRTSRACRRTSRARRRRPLEPGLVRGLDYYTRTAFEFYVAGREGQQQALGGGGRYDGLVELLGGRPTPGIGFGLGSTASRWRGGHRSAATAASTGAARGRRWRRSRGHGRRDCGSPPNCARPGSRARADLASEARQAARGGRPRRGPFRGHRRRRARQRPGPAPRPPGGHPAGDPAELSRELARRRRSTGTAFRLKTSERVRRPVGEPANNSGRGGPPGPRVSKSGSSREISVQPVMATDIASGQPRDGRVRAPIPRGGNASQAPCALRFRESWCVRPGA